MPRILPSRLLFAVACLLLMAGTTAQAEGQSTLTRIQERGTLILGTSGNMPSMSQVDAAGKLSGFDIDLARIMARSMGVKLEARVIPFKDLLPALENGEVDMVISNLTITPQRNLRVAFVGPYLESGKCMVTKNSSLANAGESTDLNTPDTRLAVLAGSTSEIFARELFPQATLVAFDDYEKAVKMVSADEVNGMLTEFPICLVTLKNNPDAGFVSVFSLLTYEPIGIALPANDTHFINWTENFLDRMNGTNGIEELGARWFGKLNLKK